MKWQSLQTLSVFHVSDSLGPTLSLHFPTVLSALIHLHMLMPPLAGHVKAVPRDCTACSIVFTSAVL